MSKWQQILDIQILSILADLSTSWIFDRFKPSSVSWLVLWRINIFQVIFRWIKFWTIQFSINVVFVYKQLIVKTVLLQTIQFCINTQFKCQKSSV